MDRPRGSWRDNRIAPRGVPPGTFRSAWARCETFAAWRYAARGFRGPEPIPSAASLATLITGIANATDDHCGPFLFVCPSVRHLCDLLGDLFAHYRDTSLVVIAGSGRERRAKSWKILRDPAVRQALPNIFKQLHRNTMRQIDNTRHELARSLHMDPFINEIRVTQKSQRVTQTSPQSRRKSKEQETRPCWFLLASRPK